MKIAKMRSTFKDLVPADELCIGAFSCAFQSPRSLCIGRLYLSLQHLSFKAFVGDTRVIIHISSILVVVKKTVMGLPSGLDIIFKDGSAKWTLQHFIYREDAYLSINAVMVQFAELVREDPGSGSGLRRRPTIILPPGLQKKISQRLLSLQAKAKPKTIMPRIFTVFAILLLVVNMAVLLKTLKSN